ncbi:MAG: serine/threonine-protein kinase [Myxococcaceae bacterium]
MTLEEAEAAIREVLGQTGQVASTLGTVIETIVRPGPSAEGESESLPALTAADGPDVVLFEELGRGGMGVVNRAEQQSLSREVAVKSAHEGDDVKGRALIREARIMGSLEHPNLVPIHALVASENGTPQLVMKRVEGTAWSELLRDELHPAWPPLLVGHGDRMRANVDVLIQVSRALAFAHDRGVIHRDLKPANVMIGNFGEVYLLDWGAAIRLTERETEQPAIAGTPGYMAPEMVRGDPKQADERTDVYLLGATLFQVLAGRAPHQAEGVVEALAAALSGQVPELPPSAPGDLVSLVRKSMSLEKSERPRSAEAFREELARYLVSRDAEVVAEQARAAVRLGEEKLLVEGPTSADGFRGLIEGRFGFSSAAKLRPEDDSIRRELDSATVKLVEREVALRSPRSARALLGQLGASPPELVAKVEALEKEASLERSAADELLKTKRAADPSAAVGPFLKLFGLVGGPGIMIGGWMSIQAAKEGRGLTVLENVALDAGTVAAYVLGVLLGRKSFFSTPASSKVTLYYIVGLSCMALANLYSLAFGRDTSEATGHAMFAGAVVMAVVAATEIWEIWAGVAIHLVAMGLMFAFPMYASLLCVAGLGLDTLVYIWAFRNHASRARVLN